MPIKDLQQFAVHQNSDLSLTSARRKFMEDYRGKVVTQLKQLETTLEKIDYKIDLFKQLETTESNHTR